MTTQFRKNTLGLSGEFFVAAELLRREVLAAVTYGNAKKADVVAFSASRKIAVAIEVKSTASYKRIKWVVGNKNPEPSEDIWVFVHIPEQEHESPRFFILTASEIHTILAPGEEEYRRKFLAKNGKEPTGKGVYSVRLDQVEKDYEDRWEKVLKCLEPQVDE